MTIFLGYMHQRGFSLVQVGSYTHPCLQEVGHSITLGHLATSRMEGLAKSNGISPPTGKEDSLEISLCS